MALVFSEGKASAASLSESKVQEPGQGTQEEENGDQGVAQAECGQLWRHARSMRHMVPLSYMPVACMKSLMLAHEGCERKKSPAGERRGMVGNKGLAVV